MSRESRGPEKTQLDGPPGDDDVDRVTTVVLNQDDGERLSFDQQRALLDRLQAQEDAAATEDDAAKRAELGPLRANIEKLIKANGAPFTSSEMPR